MSDMEKKISAEGDSAGAESVSVVERAARVVPVEVLEELADEFEDARTTDPPDSWSRGYNAAIGVLTRRLRFVANRDATTVDPETTPSGFTDRRESDERDSGVPQPLTREAADGLRGALEALADQWERDWEASIATGVSGLGEASRKGAANRLRAVLAAHPADPPATPEPSGDVVEEVARLAHSTLLNHRHGSSCNSPAPEHRWDAVSTGRAIARALADADLLVDPAEAERHEHSVAWAWRCANGYAECAEKAETERDRAHARVAELEAEVERWTEKAQESGKAYADANTKHHAELDRANRLERLAETLAGRAVDLEDAQRRAEGERDRARDLAARLEADNARLTRERDEAQMERSDAEAARDEASAEVERLAQAAASANAAAVAAFDGNALVQQAITGRETAEAEARAAHREAERLRDRVGPCHCITAGPGIEGPDETCPEHGRRYAEWIARGDAVAKERDHLREALREVLSVPCQHDGPCQIAGDDRCDFGESPRMLRRKFEGIARAALSDGGE